MSEIGWLTGIVSAAGDDVVARRGVVRRIEAEEVAAAGIDEFGVDAAELPVGPGIAEIEGELLGLDVDLDRRSPARG